MVSSFELHLRAEHKSEKTITTYLDAARWFAAAHLLPAGVTDWADVRARHVQQWMVWLLGNYADTYASDQFRARCSSSSGGTPPRTRTSRALIPWPS